MDSDSVKKDLQNLEHLGESADSQFAAHILNCLDSKNVGKTTLCLSEYIKFWGELCEKNKVYSYAHSLFNKFRAYDDEMKKTKRCDITIDFENTYKSIGLSLLCLNLFWDLTKTDSKMEMQISQWMNDKTPSVSAKAILDLLKCNGDNNAMIDRTLSDYLSLDELKTTINMSTGDVDIDTQNFNFLSWLFIISCGSKRQGVKSLLDKLFIYIEQISKSLNDIETAGPRLLLVLDIYYDIYTFYPYVEPHYLSKLLQFIEPLQYLPLPYSKEIKSIMKHIKEEICCPGYTLRCECLNDNIFLNSYGEDLINSKHLTSSIIASKVQRGLFIFHNIPSFSSTQYNHIFQKSYVSDGEWVENVYKLRCLMIYDILHYDFDIIIENNNNNSMNNSSYKSNDGLSFSILGKNESNYDNSDDVLNYNNFTFDELILKCESSKIVEWYARVREIQNICLSIEDLTNIKPYRESQLLPVLLDIIDTIYATVKIKCDYKILRYEFIKPTEGLNIKDDIYLSLDKSKIEMIPNDEAVKQVMNIPDYLIEVEQLESSQSSNDNSNGVFPDIIEGEKLYVIMSDLTDLESLTYISSHVLYSLSETTNKDIPSLLQQSSSNNNNNNNNNSSNIPLPVLRLCYLGDSSVIHRMVCSYIGIRYKCRSYTELVDYRYYVLPYGKNLLAQYLAMTDILYRKLIYCMMQSPDIVPSLEKHEDKPNPEILNITNPYKLQKYMIHSFIRSSRIVTYMKIYLCEGWLNTNMSNSPDVKIPFIMRVELGCAAGAQMQFRETNEHFIRHLSDKSFNRSPLLNTPSVIIQYTEVNTNGKQISSVQKPPVTYTRIVIANAPIPEDWVYCNVRPSDPWLNLHMIETHPVLSTHINKKDDKDLRNYLIQGGKRCDVGSVIIQSQNTSDVFPVLIDDKLFGQFRKIRIVPCILDGHTQEAIPIVHCAEY